MEPGRTIRDGSVLASAAMRAKFPQPGTRGRKASTPEDAENFAALLQLDPTLANMEIDLQLAERAHDSAGVLKVLRAIALHINEDNAACASLPKAVREACATAARRMRQKYEITTR